MIISHSLITRRRRRQRAEKLPEPRATVTAQRDVCVFVFLFFLFFRGQSRTSCFCVFLKQSITTVSLKGTLSLCEAGGETVKLDRYDESERESWEDQTLWQRAA